MMLRALTEISLNELAYCGAGALEPGPPPWSTRWP